MDNQHKHIKGYRDLSQEEIDLMNKIKEKGAEMIQLHAQLNGMLDTQREMKLLAARKSVEGAVYQGVPYTEHTGATDECQEYRRFIAAEPQRWAAIGKTDTQTGIMALIRAVAQPAV